MIRAASSASRKKEAGAELCKKSRNYKEKQAEKQAVRAKSILLAHVYLTEHPYNRYCKEIPSGFQTRLFVHS